MRIPTFQTQRNRSRGTISYTGCTDCISYPYHKLHLQEKLAQLADASFMTKSMLVREWIDKEYAKYKEQIEVNEAIKGVRNS